MSLANLKVYFLQQTMLADNNTKNGAFQEMCVPRVNVDDGRRHRSICRVALIHIAPSATVQHLELLTLPRMPDNATMHQASGPRTKRDTNGMIYTDE